MATHHQHPGRLTEVLDRVARPRRERRRSRRWPEQPGLLIAMNGTASLAGAVAARSSLRQPFAAVVGPIPETGTVAYTFDANGNVSAKTDARGVVTNFGYDALGRLLSKTYTGTPAGTMANCYQYDTAANGVGRLGFEWTQSAGCPTPLPGFPANRGLSVSPCLRCLRCYGARAVRAAVRGGILHYCVRAFAANELPYSLERRWSAILLRPGRKPSCLWQWAHDHGGRTISATCPVVCADLRRSRAIGNCGQFLERPKPRRHSLQRI